jgi:predicted nucleic acid-binding protein
MILVDSSVWIDLFQWGHFGKGIRDIHQFERVKNTLTQLDILHATPIKTYIHGAEIYRVCREKGLTIRKTNDCLIAAVSIEHSCPLLHKDKDFNAIAQCVDLQLYRE